MEAKLYVRPIGVVHTPHKSKYSAPRQPATAAEKSIGVITLDGGNNFEQALEDLQGFEYIWVIFWFHKNRSWKPKVLPPHSGRTKRGLFSTRSPHRPNPIGLSLCRIVDIKGRTIRVENPDMLDETPILDIKPYIPHAESHPKSRAGWIDELNERSAPLFKVDFAPEVRKALNKMVLEERREVKGYLTGLLSRDPFPHVYRRIRKASDGTSVVAVKRWRFRFTVENMNVHVLDVTYSNDNRLKS